MRALFLIVFFGVSSVFSQKLETILQTGHSKYVTATDFHPNGKFLASASIDNSVILWNLENGKQIRNLIAHTAAVWSVDFNPDGTQVLTSSADQTAKVFDVQTGQLIHSINIPKDDVRQAYYSPKGKYFYLYDNRDGVHVYQASDAKFVGTFRKNYAAGYQRNIINDDKDLILSTSGYKGAEVIHLLSGDTLLSLPFDKVFGSEFSPDGTKISLSSSKLFAQIFDAESGKLLHELVDPSNDARCDGCNTKQVWSPDSKYVLTMSNKVDAILWDANSGKKIKSFIDKRYRPTVMKFTDDGDYIVLNIDETIFAYQVKSGKMTMCYEGIQLDYFDINPSPNNQWIALPGENNTIEIHNIRTGKVQKRLSGYLNHDRTDGLKYSYENWTHTSILKYMSMGKRFDIHPDGKIMALGGIDSAVVLLNLETGRVERTLDGHQKVVLAFAFSNDGKLLATGSGDRTIKIWDVASGKELETLKGHMNLVFDVAFNSDNSQLVSASWDGSMIVWELEDGSYRFRDLGGDSPYKVGFTPNDLYVISGDLKNRLDFWEVDALERFRNLVGHTETISDFAFSPDGKQLATASWDGKVKIWDVLTGMLVNRQSVGAGAVYALDWSKDGQSIAYAGANTTIYLWNPSTNENPLEFQGHSEPVTDLQFIKNDKKLVSHGASGQIKVWDLTREEEIYSRIQIARNEWLATSPSGHFDGTKKALELVNYVNGMDVAPVGSVFDKYFSPSLINRINKGESFNDRSENIQELIKTPPLIAFHLFDTDARGSLVDGSIVSSKKNILSIGIELNSQDEKVEEILIYNNGKLVISESLEKEIVFRGGDKSIQRFEIPLVDGDNEISARVINVNRTESAPIKMNVNFDGEKAKTDLYVLTVGINKYKNSSYDLSYAVGDARAFLKVLKDGGDTLFNQIHDYSLTNAEATKPAIGQVVNEISQEIGPEDVFVFYYAGHGVMSFAENQEDSEFFIVTHDVTNLYGDVQLLEDKGVSAKELMQYSVDITAAKQLYLLDACHSGGALEAFATRGGGREKALAQLARSTGTFFITASQDQQYANEVGGNLKHGLFTYALLEVLQGKEVNKSGEKVTISEMKSYVEDRVPELSEKYHGTPQYPTSYSFGQDFPIVILP